MEPLNEQLQAHPSPLMGFTPALFVHVDRQKAPGPLWGRVSVSPPTGSAALLLFCMLAVTGQHSSGAKSTCRI